MYITSEPYLRGRILRKTCRGEDDVLGRGIDLRAVRHADLLVRADPARVLFDAFLGGFALVLTILQAALRARFQRVLRTRATGQCRGGGGVSGRCDGT